MPPPGQPPAVDIPPQPVTPPPVHTEPPLPVPNPKRPAQPPVVDTTPEVPPPLPIPNPKRPPVVDNPPIAKPKPCVDCGTQIDKPEPPKIEEDCRVMKTCEPPQPVKGQCVDTLKVKKERKELDILFVVDTSASLRRGGTGSIEDGELVKIAENMVYFVRKLDPQTDYQIAFLLGHGINSSRYHGRLFTSGEDDPAIIRYKDLARGGRSQAAIEKRLTAMLRKKMLRVPNESGGAQGEALLHSLYSATARLGTLKKFVREDAALSVIFVTDEQDVCFDYDSKVDEFGQPAYKPTLKTKVGKGGAKEMIVDPYETAYFNQYCKHAVHKTKSDQGRPLTEGIVADALERLKNSDSSKGSDRSKVILNGIIYTQDVPEDLRGRVEDENEWGHGIWELILNTGGKMADLTDIVRNQAQFKDKLEELGQYNDFRLRYKHVFNCNLSKDFHPESINFTSMTMKVISGSGEHLGTFAAQCSSRANCPAEFNGPLQVYDKAATHGGIVEYKEVRVAEDLMTKMVEDYRKKTGKDVEGGQVVIEFMTRSDRNPRTGAAWRKEDMVPVQTKPSPLLGPDTDMPPASIAQPPAAGPSAAPKAGAPPADQPSTPDMNAWDYL
ncbi:MAG: hypothetical protein AB7F86_01130 [Bdellovibrionales bacterium]